MNPRYIKHCVTIIALAALLVATASAQDAPAPAPASAPDANIAKRAADDLAAFYSDANTVSPCEKAIAQLKDKDEAARTAAGKYLADLLAQAYADQASGRAPSKSLPYWGGGVENSAEELRKQIAQKLADAGGGDAGLDAAQWLIEKDDDLDNQANGFKYVAATKTPAADAIVRGLLSPPHHNAEVLIGAIKEAAARKLPVAGEITKLCGWYRKAVRDAARDAAAKLGVKKIPAFDPEAAFTPWLDKEMKDIAAMIYPPIPKEAKWTRYIPVKDGKAHPEAAISGFPMETKDGVVTLLGYYGYTYSGRVKALKQTPRAMADDAAIFAKVRATPVNSLDSMNARQDVLSVRGALTAQFEPAYVSVPEALLAAWSYARGDKKLAAQIIFPRIDESPDDGEFASAVRELIGKIYNQEMLDAFCAARDYDEAIRVAKHISEPEFDGYFYQGVAKALAAQLQKRSADFKTFTLPAPDDWAKQKATMSREEQIKFLADRLRLLNCAQTMQPGDVNYSDKQTALPLASQDKAQHEVINPFNELRAMKMTPAEIAVLAPYLLDDDYMPTYSYWRDFHPVRHLHIVFWVVTDLIDDDAGSNIADLDSSARTPQGRQQAVDKVLAWCKANASKSLETRLLDTLTTTKDWNEFARVAGQAVREKIPAAAPVMQKRLPDFDASHREDMLEICYALNSPDAVPIARDWLAAHPAPAAGAGDDADETVRFWSAMLVLRASKPEAPEGLDVLKAILAGKNAAQWYPHAFELLMALKTPEAADIAAGALKAVGRSDDFFTAEITKDLFLAGRKEALDFMLAWLDDNGEAGTSWTQNSAGEQVSVKLVNGDNAAMVIAQWRTDKYSYDITTPAQQRKAGREKLKPWLKDQFALVLAGKQPEAISKPAPLPHVGQPFVDAP